MARHSRRALANTTRQFRGIILFLKRDLKTTKAARAKIYRYRRLPGYLSMKRAYDNDIKKTIKDLRYYTKVYAKYKAQGKVL